MMYVLPETLFCMNLFLPIILLRNYMSPQDKLKYSDLVPVYFDEIVYGLMLGDGNMRMNGNHALLSIQQTHSEIVKILWAICYKLKLVINPIKTLNRNNWKTIYYFQTLTMPYFTKLYNIWYDKEGIKVLPNNIRLLLSPLALAYWIMGDGSFDKYGRGLGRVSLHTENFTLTEVELLQRILLSKYSIKSSLYKGQNKDPMRGYIIRIPARSLKTLQELCKPHMRPSLMYKLGL